MAKTQEAKTSTKTAKKRTKQVRKKQTFQRTISAELFEQWQRMTRHGDIKLIVNAKLLSQPTAVRALTYGYCAKQKTIDIINKFFEDRIKEEAKQSSKFAKTA